METLLQMASWLVETVLAAALLFSETPSAPAGTGVPVLTPPPQLVDVVSPSHETDDPEPTATPTPEPTPAPTPETTPTPTPEPIPETVYAAADKLYILMFHDVAPDGTDCNSWTVTESDLRANLQWLSDHGYTTILPSQLAKGEALPPKAVLLTFDDGYASSYTLTYPILREFQAKAVISLITHYTEEREADLRVPFLSWEMCREMAGSGLVEFGSHTYNCHIREQCVARMENETQEEYEQRVFPDIEKSVRLMEDKIGAPVTFFAYPNGLSDPWSDQFIDERFAVTVTTTYGPAKLQDGLHHLPRIMVSPDCPVWKRLPE